MEVFSILCLHARRSLPEELTGIPPLPWDPPAPVNAAMRMPGIWTPGVHKLLVGGLGMLYKRWTQGKPITFQMLRNLIGEIIRVEEKSNARRRVTSSLVYILSKSFGPNCYPVYCITRTVSVVVLLWEYRDDIKKLMRILVCKAAMSVHADEEFCRPQSLEQKIQVFTCCHHLISVDGRTLLTMPSQRKPPAVPKKSFTIPTTKLKCRQNM